MYREKMYLPGDVRRILGRAAELTEAEPQVRNGEGPPRTLREIEALGAELGIRADLVRRAAGLESEGDSTQKVSLLTGGPSRILYERQVRGAFVAADHPRVARLIRRATGDAGAPQPLGDALGWTSRAPARQLSVNVEPDDGGVYVRVEENLQALRGQMFGGVLGGLGGGGVSVAVLLAAEIAPVLMPVAAVMWLGGVYLLARRLYASRAATREREARELCDAICEAVAEGGAGEKHRIATETRAEAEAEVERDADDVATALREERGEERKRWTPRR